MPWCFLCETEDCFTHPPIDHHDSYPFLPGGRPRVPGVEGIDFVVAQVRVMDHELGRVTFGVGDRVPMGDAVRHGLVSGPEKPPPKARPRGKRKAGGRARKGPEHDRARKPSEDRS